MTNRDRYHQILRWLVDVFPTDKTVSLRVVKRMPKHSHDCLGACVWSEDGRVLIWIQNGPRPLVIPTLLHEFAHVLTDGRGEAGGHGDEFYQVYGALEREFHATGAVDSATY